VLLIHDAAALGYGWNVVVNTWTDLSSNSPLPTAHGRATLEGWLSSEAGRGLFAAAGLDFESSLRAAARAGFKAMPMRLTVDAAIENAIRRFDSAICCAVAGGERKHEYVVYCAHWDGLGGMQTAP